jgi:hypothetical protein
MERLETEEGSLGEGSGVAVHGRGDSSRRSSVAGGRSGAGEGEGATGTGAPPPASASVAADESEGAAGEGGKRPEGAVGTDQPGEDLSSWLAGFLEGDEPGDR